MAIKKGDNSYMDGTKPKSYQLYFENVGPKFTLPIPPSQVQIGLTERVAVSQTLHGIHADDYGEGVISISIAGSFGWGSKGVDGAQSTAKQIFARLVHLWENRAKLVKVGNPDDYPIHFIDNQRNNYMLCVMPDFRVEQVQQSPLVIRYTMTLLATSTLQLFGGLEGTTPIVTRKSQAQQSSTSAAPNNPVLHNTVQTVPDFPPSNPASPSGQTIATTSTISTPSTSPQTIADEITYLSGETTLTSAEQFHLTALLNQISTPNPDAVLPGVASLPVARTTISQIAREIYGSNAQPYIDTLRSANALSYINPQRTQGVPFIRYPDRLDILDAPFDGTLSFLETKR